MLYVFMLAPVFVATWAQAQGPLVCPNSKQSAQLGKEARVVTPARVKEEFLDAVGAARLGSQNQRKFGHRGDLFF